MENNAVDLCIESEERTQAEQTLCVLYSFRPGTARDILTLKASIQKSATVADAFALLLLDNPLSVSEAPDWKECESLFSKDDVAWFRECASGDLKKIRKATAGWVASVAGKADGNMAKRVEASLYEGEFNPELEQGKAFELAATLGTDWVIVLGQGEILEAQSDRRKLDLLMTHPDPSVTAWGLSWYTHWDTDSLYRIDAPWGDSGEYRGHEGNIKMFRTTELTQTPIAKECSLRVRDYSLLRQQDRVHSYMKARQANPGANNNYLLDDEGMQMGKFLENTKVGLHVLAYEGENPDDYSRLFCDLYGVVDHIVVVWTGEGTEPCDRLKKIVDLYKADLIFKPLDKNLSAARNAGIDHLSGLGCSWAAFFDPDEICKDWQQMARDIRRMSEISNSWGWMVKFENVQRDGQSSESETVRMTRLDGSGTMRMNGRIHEGFSASIAKIREAGVHPKLRYAQFTMVNTGQAVSDERVQAKLEKYTDLLIEELNNNPDCSQAWHALGLQCENDGSRDKAVECYINASNCSDDSYLPHRELGTLALQDARRHYHNVLSRLNKAHSSYEYTNSVCDILDRIAPNRPYLGKPKALVEQGLPLPGISFELPDFK